jgi:hypothetical protein
MKYYSELHKLSCYRPGYDPEGKSKYSSTLPWLRHYKGGQQHVLAAFTPRKDLVPIVQDAGWAPGPVWTGAENLAPTGIQFLDLPARSQSLYRLRYPAQELYNVLEKWYECFNTAVNYVLMKVSFDRS